VVVLWNFIVISKKKEIRQKCRVTYYALWSYLLLKGNLILFDFLDIKSAFILFDFFFSLFLSLFFIVFLSSCSSFFFLRFSFSFSYNLSNSFFLSNSFLSLRVLAQEVTIFLKGRRAKKKWKYFIMISKNNWENSNFRK